MPKIQINLLSDLRSYIKGQFRAMGCEVPTYSNNHELLRKYFNIHSKTIRPVPRTIYKSNEMKKGEFDTYALLVCKELESKLEKGELVTPYLSTRAINPDDNDALLIDWGIYHLHLSNTRLKGRGQFYGPADFLLFAVVRDNAVYLIDIRPHNEDYVFVQRQLIEIVHNNWPQLLEPFELRGISRPKNNPTSLETHKMRKAHANVIVELGGKAYGPMGGGSSTAGTNILHTINADRWIFQVRYLHNYICNHIHLVFHHIKEHRKRVPGVLHFKLLIDGLTFKALETNSRIAFS